MGDFFKSSRFKILAFLLALVFAFMLRAASSGDTAPLLANITGILVTPLQRLSVQATHAVQGLFSPFFAAPALAKENEALRDELAVLRNQLVNFEKYRVENEQLKDYLEIKDKNPDFDFEPAMVVGRGAADRYYSFTIDKGSADGICAGNPVITAEGLVGVVSEIGTAHAKVLTILDTTVEVGAMDMSTREIGITSGAVDLALQNRLRLSYLPRDTAAKKGGLIVTTGVDGLFPKDLIIGVIESLQPDGQGLSLYAIVAPPADLRTVHDVLVIKHFEGQKTSSVPEQGRVD
ncbi:MAG: rod shape-determining protein MreC [Oscillospiraceae bacterium]